VPQVLYWRNLAFTYSNLLNLELLKLAVVIVAAYVAALGLAALPHCHTTEGRAIVEFAAGSACSEGCSPSGCPFQESIPNSPTKNPFSPRCNADCLLCQFLVQPSALCGESAPLVVVAPPVEAAAAEVPLVRPCLVLPVWYIRGPPLQM